MDPRPGSALASRHDTAAWLVAGLFLAFWLWTLCAPSGNPLLPPSGPQDRLFPGVPLGWVLGRLGCLVIGVGVGVWATSPDARQPEAAIGSEGAEGASGAGRLGIAAAFALASGLTSLLRESFGPGLQALWISSLCLPALVLLLGPGRGTGARRSASEPWGPGWSAAAVVGAWLLLRDVLAPGNLRAAQLVDLWQSFGWLQQALVEGSNPLLASGQPGIANVYMLLVGFPFLYDGGSGDFRTIQVVHGAWLGISALAVAALCRGLLPGRSPAVATAAYLFSPFMLALGLSASPFGVFLALGAGALLLLARFAAGGSAASLVGLGTVLGLACMSAYLWPLILAVGAVALWLWARKRPRTPAVLAVALLAFGSSALASLPLLTGIERMPHLYGERTGSWSTFEALLLGQSRADFSDPDGLWRGEGLDSVATPLTVAAGALLSPFAAPRTPIRLWLDGLFDPISTWLAALGLAACVLRLHRFRDARALVLLLAVALLPATVASAYDRASLLRNLLLPIPVALLASEGLRRVARLVTRPGDAPPGYLRGGAVLAIAVCGVFIFDVLTPRRLPGAATAIALEALAGQPPAGDRVWLDFGIPARLDWLYTREILSQLAEAPIEVVPWVGPGSMDPVDAVVAPELVLWSAGLETQHGVGRALCTRWPSGRVYVLLDGSGHSRAFAAEAGPDRRPREAPWQPALPVGRAGAIPCGELPALLPGSGDPP